ncbi:ferric reductase-like transmembrane domain-containing protein [Streptomyces durmitorensis]|uniref:Cytochrome b/b6 domain-containing protein n=1 Tax=Streptomyces durmitorensis TaxID=319947 RepID=A0ABY4PZM4_9ACTN|nr:ferric reductase-like transmembrane domain-containing protein [Streptomyces durmitorensis]UQT58594.1 cytochrome b/b6 domain-containing protein [Streptomyces durmitorensis]
MNPLNPHRKSRTNRANRQSRSFAAFPEPSRTTRGVLTTAALLLIPLLVVLGSDAFRAALDFTTGVLSLVSLTAAVVWGLVASDRLFLHSRQRLLAQAVHRATAVASIGFLLLHVSVKLALDHVSPVGALIPFGLGFSGSDGLIGLGSLAGLLMVVTGVTGALRSAFASPVQVASRWRALHMLAYPAWCSALIHGLYAGREPKPWVIALYCLCLVAVAGAVALRAAPLPIKRKAAARILALLEPEGRARNREPVRRDTAESPLPGTAAAPGRAPEAASDPPPVVGIAAAYRVLASTNQPTEVVPSTDPPPPRWPAPSPPPPAEAPHIPYDPPYDTHSTAYGFEDTSYRSHDTAYDPPPYDPPYDAAHDPPYEAPYQAPYDSGPATEPLPNTFQAPSSGEPWNAATGGNK